MGKRNRLQEIEERMLFLKAVMQDDGRAMKCFKTNKSYAELYPEDYKKYIEANDEYNALEEERDALKAELEKEERQNEEAGRLDR